MCAGHNRPRARTRARHRRRSRVSDLPPEPPKESSTPRKADHPSGWRVDPAPDGRGAPPERKPPRIPRSRRLLAILLGLLALNLVLSFVTRGPAGRERVPHQPFFVDQVQAGNVSQISSKNDSIEGELKHEATYDPPGKAKPVKVTKFKTEVPAFIDPAQLTKLLDQQNVVINAKAPDSGRSLWVTVLLGFLPWILLVAFFIWLARRGAGAGGVLGGFGRSTARRITPGEQERVTFDDVAGIDEAEDEL